MAATFSHSGFGFASKQKQDALMNLAQQVTQKRNNNGMRFMGRYTSQSIAEAKAENERIDAWEVQEKERIEATYKVMQAAEDKQAAEAAEAARENERRLHRLRCTGCESDSEVEAQEVKPYMWEHAMKGADTPTKYERCDIDGKAYLYHLKTKKFLGMWDEKKNKINSDVEDPCY